MQRFTGERGEDTALVFDGKAQALENNLYRRVVATNSVQIVLYSLELGEVLPLESHCNATQILHVATGKATVYIAEERTKAAEGDVVVVTPGTPHRIMNASKSNVLKMWSVYTAPQFKNDRVDERQPRRKIATGAPVMALGRGFAPRTTINETEGGVCIAVNGSAVCGHSHESLTELKAWLLAKADTAALCPKCEVEASIVGFTIPRLLPRRRKKKGREQNVTTWHALHPFQRSSGSSVKFSVVTENPKKHPWAGFTSKNNKKYALAGITPYAIDGLSYEDMKKPRQGVHLVLEHAKSYEFSTKKIPEKFPLYITESIFGGEEAAEDPLAIPGQLPKGGATKRSDTLIFTAVMKPGLHVAYYQCTKFQNMGGPITVHAQGEIPVFTAGDSAMVLQNVEDGTFTVMLKGAVDHRSGLDFDSALSAVGARVRRDWALAVGGLHCKTIVPAEDESASGDECPHHADEPAILVRAHTGTRFCKHVHTLGELMQRLESNPLSPCAKCG